ncbi:hypothetical protein J7443_05235 [Tropicibacter sp. R15_0]|uniref:hypothetical protein n=1 Tax=Tropicibacter sp. R15_0 TaxID=2821101 RepID=UPI001ADA62B4|nr:hypothetical protein [Tropicibacter sp. R15_0]MBO9464624.1 hypothetical protein [Tropicibacter sp. R15_0]
MLKTAIQSVLTAIVLTLPLQAQAQDPVFASYDEMRDEMDRMMVTRDIQSLMLRFGGSDEMTPQQLDQLAAQVEQIYPTDFENVVVIRKGDLQGGFQQELIAYWTGLSYVYAYVLYHDLGDRVVAINFRFNSDFSTLNSLF